MENKKQEMNKSHCAEWNQMKLKILSTGPLQDERICFRGSEYILFEILDLWPAEKTEIL